VAALEERIAQLETEVASWEEKMASPEFFKKGSSTKAAMDSYNAAKAEIDASYEKWGRLSEEITNAGDE
jgi:predicted  nucleic acid-binding Zn-ribbon protein